MRSAVHRATHWLCGRRRLTLFARTVLIMLCEVAGNAVLWAVAALVFLHGAGDGHRILGLALVAWTTGLRHGLDADHISAIDNATRRIVSVPQCRHDTDGRSLATRMRRPVTVGLFFSLGHSTIVFATTVAIAISAKVATRLDNFGSVGGIIGASVSGSFLVLIGCINSVILYKTWRRLKAAQRAQQREESSGGGGGGGGDGDDDNVNIQAERSNGTHHFNGLMTRIAMPLLRSVDRPWKMYPVGVLFGLGFDTASSIALLSVATIAQQDIEGDTGNDAKVILLALLFTAGMTMVDSADSCLMIWAYAPDLGRTGRKRVALWEDGEQDEAENETDDVEGQRESEGIDRPSPADVDEEQKKAGSVERPSPTGDEDDDRQAVLARTASVSIDVPASRVSLVLTLLSILVAFAIGIIVLLGLIGDQCARCAAAADRQETDNNGGLEGRWWLAWRRANDNSGYVGAAIVGAFAVCVAVWFSVRAFKTSQRKRRLRRTGDRRVDDAEQARRL